MTKSDFNSNLGKFFYTDIYLALILALTVVSWKFGLTAIAFVAMMVMITLILFFLDDITPIIPVFFAIPYIFPIGVTPEKYLYLAVFIIPVAIGLVYHVIKYRQKVRIGKLFVGQLLISVALVLGGIASLTSMKSYLFGLPTALFLGFGILILYFAFDQYVKPRANISVYYAKIMTMIGLLITVELAIFMLTHEKEFFDIAHKDVTIGALISNNIVTVLLLTVPFSFYLFVTTPRMRILYFIIGALQMFAIFFTYSRGGVLSLVIIFPIILTYTFIKSRNKLSLSVCLVTLIAFILLLYFCFQEELNTIILRMSSFDTDSDDISNGRFALYREAVELFKRYPIFGVGFGYQGPNFYNDILKFYWFHSTVFQVIASLGSVGIIAYSVYYFCKLKIVFTNITRNCFNFFVLIAFLGFEGYSMIDTGTFIPMPMMVMVTLTTLMVEKANPVYSTERLPNDTRIVLYLDDKKLKS